MATQTIQQGPSPLLISQSHFSWFKRYFIRRFHPRSIFVDVAAGIWFVYFFWHHDWVSAVAIVIIGRVASMLLTMRVDTDAFVETFLGKMALLHLNPANMIIQIIGLVVALYGVWVRSTEAILAGSSLVFLGHIFGWGKVDPRYGDGKAGRKEVK